MHKVMLAGSEIVAFYDPASPINVAPITSVTHQEKEARALTTELTWPGLLQVMASFPNAYVDNSLKEYTQRQLHARTAPVKPKYVPEAPLKPYPWQSEAAARFASVASVQRGAAYLMDEMGAGKTGSALYACRELQETTGQNVFVLVVCPAAVVSSWVESVHKWTGWEPTDYRGPRRSLDKATNILVTSYETMRNDEAKLKPWLSKPGRQSILVLDECHYIKSPDALRTMVAGKLAVKARHCIAMSGTPIAKMPTDAHPSLKCLDPVAYPSKTRMSARYCDEVMDETGKIISTALKADTRPEFDLGLLGVQRRVTKKQAMPWLPPKVYVARDVAIPPKWRDAYDKYAKKMIAELPDDMGTVSTMHTLSQLQHLQMLASAPCKPVKAINAKGDEYVQLIPQIGGWKTQALLDVLAETDGSVAVFSPSKRLINCAGAELAAKGVSHTFLTGDVTGKARDRNKDDFQAGKYKAVLVTTGAGGVGITLTKADTVVFLSRPWSLIESQQAEDRSHRLGSEIHDKVCIIDLVARNTVDVAVRETLMSNGVVLADLVKDRDLLVNLLGGTV